MTSRNAAKRRGHELFAAIEDAFIARGDDQIDVAPFFGSESLRIRGKVFAFIGFDGELVAKLPADRVTARSAESDAMPMVMRGRAMREWLVVPQTEADTWAAVVDEAFAFVDGITPAGTG